MKKSREGNLTDRISYGGDIEKNLRGNKYDKKEDNIGYNFYIII